MFPICRWPFYGTSSVKSGIECLLMHIQLHYKFNFYFLATVIFNKFCLIIKFNFTNSKLVFLSYLDECRTLRYTLMVNYNLFRYKMMFSSL